MLNIRRTLACALTAAVAISFASAVSTSAHGQDGTAQSQVVSAVPATYTPDINNGTTYAINQVGTQIITGGSFTTESNHGSTAVVSQKYLFAFNASTGAINTAFAPVLDGTVQSIEPGPSADTVYVAGSFATVNGVKSKSIVLLSTTTGAIVSGWKPVVPNGVGQAIRYVNNQLLLGGNFSTVGNAPHSGLVSLNPNTGAMTSYTNVQFTGHHNYGVNGTGANAGVGVNAMTVSPDGTRLVAIGNFKNANGIQRDQIAMLDLTGTGATLDPNWNTNDFTAACYQNAYDSYVRDVDWAPNGQYFVVGATGGSGSNTDGSRSLCDSATRWSATDTGSNVHPTWIDYTGNDTILSVAITDTVVYVGGHQRWLNNPNALDRAGAGAVARPGMAALDPVSGLPLTWNPGRNPRGAGAYALFASATGIYVGSDTMYFGNYKYLHKRIGYFPLTGGYVPASTATAALPANVYEAGPITGSTTALAYRPYSGSTIGALTTVPTTGVDWSTTRGAFMVGSTIFYGTADGAFHEASFDGNTVGTPVSIDPYDDPTWDGVATGSGSSTYDGVKTGYYSEVANVTGAFYSNGRLYYSLAGSSSLYWRYFSPDSAIIGGQEFTVSGANLPNVAGEFLSGSTLYYANGTDGSLHTVAFSNGGTNGATPAVDVSTDHTVSGPAVDGNDWRAHGLFAFGKATGPDQPPVAKATTSCANLTCSFDGTTSSDSDGSVASYAWNFGDTATGAGSKPTHGYAKAGVYTYTLTVTDDRGVASPAFSGSVTVTAATTPPIAFRVAAHSYAASTTAAKVTTPAGVVAGDTELLVVSVSNATANAIVTPSGWTQVSTQSALPLQSAVFRRTVVAGDAGNVVTVALAGASAVALQLADYSGVTTITPVTAADTAATATHTAPSANVTAAGSWVVSYWSDRSSTTTGWNLPAALANRDLVIGTGGGHTTGAIADSAGPIATGTYPTQTGSVVGGSSAKAAMTTLVLGPQN